MGWGVSAIVAFLPLYAYENLSMRPQLADLLTGVIGLLGAVSRIGICVLTNSARQLAPWLAVLAAAATASTPLLLAAAGSSHLAWPAAIGLGAGALAWQTPAMLAIVRQEGEAARSSGLVMAGFSGMLAGPVIFGSLADVTGSYTASWLVVTFAFALATAKSTPAAVRSTKPGPRQVDGARYHCE